MMKAQATGDEQMHYVVPFGRITACGQPPKSKHMTTDKGYVGCPGCKSALQANEGSTMKVTLGGLRHVIREALDKQAVVNRLQAIAASRKPYMHGQWQTAPYQPGGRSDGDSWFVDDPELGKVFLTFDTRITYKKAGKSSRLRDPGGTRYTYVAVLSQHPYQTYGDVFTVFSYSSTGEGREGPKQTLARKQMVKLFGIDPLAYKGPIEPAKETP